MYDEDTSPAYLSMDTRGVIRGMKQKATAILDTYFASDASQSNMYSGDVVSISKDVQAAGHNTQALKDKIAASLAKIYQRYFFSVVVDVTITDIDEDEGKIDIRASVRLSNRDGATMDLVAIANTTEGTAWKHRWEDAEA